MTTNASPPLLDLCLVMPVYNEQDAIPGVLDDWRHLLDSLAINYRIIAYNDGSKDKTGEILAAYAQQFSDKVEAITKPNSGHGPTILKAYRDNAPRCEWLFQIDSDNEMGAATFPELWKARGEYDFLLGLRDGRKQPLPRKVISWVSRCVVRLFYGKTVWDVNSPYRLMRTATFTAAPSIFEQIPTDTFAPNVILSGFVGRKQLRFFQVQVPHQDRQTGEVSIKKWKLLKAAMKSFMQTIQFSFRCR